MRDRKVKKSDANVAGNEKFNSIYSKSCKMVFWTAFKYVKREDAAEEIMQEVFIKLYTRIEEIDDETAEHWLVVVAKNEALNWLKKDETELKVLESLEQKEELMTDESAEQSLLRKEKNKVLGVLRREIFEELKRKNETWYEAYTRVYCLEHPQKQVAKDMNVSIAVLHAMLYRARCWIKREYKEQYTEICDIEK